MTKLRETQLPIPMRQHHDGRLIVKLSVHRCEMGDMELLEGFKEDLSNDVEVETIMVGDNIDILSIQDQNLELLPRSIGHFSSLRVLNLSNNKLQSLPPTIGHLYSLERLILTSNQLSNLPPTVEKLKNLQTLNLDDNNLSDIPHQISGLSSLSHLTVSKNILQEVPDGISSIHTLKQLDLSKNRIVKFTPDFSQLKELQYLNLRDNSISTLPSSISALHKLQVLKLANNKLSDNPVMLKELSDLIEVDLSGNPDLLTISNQYSGKLAVSKLKNHLKNVVKSSKTHKCRSCGHVQLIGLIECEQCGLEFPHCFVCRQGFSNSKIVTCHHCKKQFHPQHLGSVYKLTSKCPHCKQRME